MGYHLLDVPNPYENAFFLIEFYLQEDGVLILGLAPWFWESSGLCIKLWIPTFDPIIDSVASTHVWVMILNMSFHFMVNPSLKSIKNALGKFHFCILETLNQYYTTVARICLEMDFDKGFSSKTNLNGRNIPDPKN